MSPEQALARRMVIDHRTDIYSLGVTLYELLVLRPAFPGNDRQELLRQVASEEPVRPRQLDKVIPFELETIVLKSMEKRPQDRYATAQELADDLRHWLADRPIRARRPSLRARLGRGGRRHKSLVAGVLAALMVGLSVLAGSIGWVARDAAARRTLIEQRITLAWDESLDWQRQRRLPEALSAARRAEGLLAGADIDEALRQRVRARRADLELLDKLENIRLEGMTATKDRQLDRKEIDAWFGQTFRDAGLDVESLPVEEAGERIGRSSVAAELAAVIDHWAAIRWTIRGMADPSWKVLLRVARIADPDTGRTRVREALKRSDEQSLLALASSKEVFDLSPATLSVLGAVLRGYPASRTQVEAFLREAQRRYPNDYWLNFNLYQFFSDRQPPQLEEAYHFAAVAVALRPGSRWAHINLGDLLLEKGCLDEAIAEFRNVVRLKADDPISHFNLGNALKRKGQLNKAIDELREAIRLKNDYAKAHLGLGIALKRKGRLDEAIAEYREAIRLKKDYARAHMAHINLGGVLLEKGRLDEAISEYREAIQIDKDEPMAYFNLGNALRDKGKLDEALVELQKAVQLNTHHAPAHATLGSFLCEKKGDYKGAIAEFREAIRLNKADPKAHYNLAVALHHEGLLVEAIDEYRETISIKRDFPNAHFGLGLILQSKGQLDEAIAEYREVIRLKENYAEAHCNLGQSLLKKGLFLAAVAELRRGHELGSRNPRWPYPSAQWVRDCEPLAKLDRKLSAIASRRERPADAAERLALASFCQRHKQFHAAAVRFYEEAFAEQPRLAEDVRASHRYSAAGSAARAGCGQGKDADKLDSKERARLRKLSLDWLRADLKAWRKELDKPPAKTGPEIAQRLQQWLHDESFAGVRGPDALTRLPKTEGPSWQGLWQEVEALRREAP